RSLLFWCALGLMILTVISGSIYHLAGRDVREDFHTWYSQLTARDIIALGVALGELTLVGAGIFFGMRLVRHGRAFLEHVALKHLPHRNLPDAALASPGASPDREEHKESHERTVKHWFHLLERFA